MNKELTSLINLLKSANRNSAANKIQKIAHDSQSVYILSHKVLRRTIGVYTSKESMLSAVQDFCDYYKYHNISVDDFLEMTEIDEIQLDSFPDINYYDLF